MNLLLFHQLLFAWFKKEGRILPWRDKKNSVGASVRETTIANYFSSRWKRDPYKVIVSELMLQQTQVDRVIPKFESFLTQWPTVRDLANAKLSEVLIAWKGLGYNRRAKFLHEMAKTIVEQYDGVFPKDEVSLRKLPGVGEYTARAVLAFAYGKDIGVIDTNIKRIFARTLFGVEASKFSISAKEFSAVVDQSVPKGKGDPWNQALMDFGATVCTAAAPSCTTCPMQTLCKANQQAQEHQHVTYAEQLLSEKKKKKNQVKKPSTPFRTTDRFFRGKVIDILREQPMHMQELRTIIEQTYQLKDRKRWGVLIESLITDGLIKIHGSIVSLP